MIDAHHHGSSAEPSGWIPVLISSVALIVSFITLWISHLARARLSVVPTGRVEFMQYPTSATTHRPLLGISVLVSNSGARVGYVSHIGAGIRLLTQANSKPEPFEGVFEALRDRLNMSNELTAPEWQAFRSFAVQGKETVLKRIFLLTVDDNSGFAFQSGDYEITIHAVESEGSKWKKWATESVRLRPEDIATMIPLAPTANGIRPVQQKSVETSAMRKAAESLKTHIQDRE